MENESVGYLRVDAQGIVRSWDERMAEMIGYSPSEIVGQSMELLIPESYRERPVSYQRYQVVRVHRAAK